MTRVIVLVLLIMTVGVHAGAVSTNLCAGDPVRRFFVSAVREGDVLHLRTGPSPKYETIGIITRDTTGLIGLGPVQPYGKSLWRKIRYGALVGWVNDAFLRPESSRIPPTSLFSVTGVPKGDVLYIRAWPSAKSREIAAIPCHATGIVGIKVWMKGGEIWRKIRFHSTEGWVNGAFLQPEGRSPWRP